MGRSLKIPTKIWSRRSVILPQFVGLTFQVHNGNRFLPVRITEEMIGFRFGEFAPTRKPTIHKETKKKR
jgi:small subunit ribosomal protein S19